MAVAIGVSPTDARAQTVGQYAAWDALMVSPTGAFIPSGDDATAEFPRNSLALRFGRWRYNTDDTAHPTYGVTLSHAVGSRSRASVTGAYVYVSCGECGGWEVSGIDFESRLRYAEHGESLHQLATSLGVRVSASGARLRTPPHTVARSVAIEVPVSIRIRCPASHDLWASVSPGLGYGNMWGPSGSDAGVLGTLGITAGSALTSSLGMELGARRVFIAGGPVDFAASFVWAFR
jgi:hypothetical protein